MFVEPNISGVENSDFLGPKEGEQTTKQKVKTEVLWAFPVMFLKTY